MKDRAPGLSSLNLSNSLQYCTMLRTIKQAFLTKFVIINTILQKRFNFYGYFAHMYLSYSLILQWNAPSIGINTTCKNHDKLNKCPYLDCKNYKAANYKAKGENPDYRKN